MDKIPDWENPKPKCKYIEENLRVEKKEEILKEESRKWLYKYLNEVWKNYNEIEKLWSDNDYPDPFVNLPRTIELEVRIAIEEDKKLNDGWVHFSKVQYKPKNEWYWWSYSRSFISNKFGKLEEILEKYKESEENEATKFFGDLWKQENLKLALTEIFGLENVIAILLGLQWSNSRIKGEKEPLKTNYPYKIIRIIKGDKERALYEEILTDLKITFSPWRLGDSLKYDIIIEKLAKREG